MKAKLPTSSCGEIAFILALVALMALCLFAAILGMNVAAALLAGGLP